MEGFLDLSQLEPIPYKNTIAVLNEYMLQNIDFLNKFGHFNETKLFEMETVLDEIESKVSLLERKLESVPSDLFNGLVVPPLQLQQPVAQPAQQVAQNDFDPHTAPNIEYQQQPVEDQQQQQQQQVIQDQQQQQQVEQPAQQQVEQQAEQQVEEVEDERLEKYKKLLGYGVPPSQLKMKMQMEGLDPNLLDKYIT